jgi:hypothetical protein
MRRLRVESECTHAVRRGNAARPRAVDRIVDALVLFCSMSRPDPRRIAPNVHNGRLGRAKGVK